MELDRLFEEIDRLILQFDEEHDVFQGGCCFVTSELAKRFEMNNIKFKLVMYVSPECFKFQTPEEICRESGCVHMSISVIYKGNECGLGEDERIDTLMDGYGIKMRIFRRTSDEIRKLEKLGDWSGLYNRNYDDEFKRRLDDVFDRYMI